MWEALRPASLPDITAINSGTASFVTISLRQNHESGTLERHFSFRDARCVMAGSAAQHSRGHPRGVLDLRRHNTGYKNATPV